MSAETRFLDRGEERIGYDVTGDGPLVICVPGMGDLRSVSRFVVPELAAAGYRLATIDLRGHGARDPTFRSYDDVATGEDILALVEHLGGRAVLLGNSMAAGSTVWAAAKRPEVIAGLVLLGPFVHNTPINVLVRWTMRLAMAGPWRTPVWRFYLPAMYAGQRPADFEEHRAAVVASLKRPGYGAASPATSHTSHAPPRNGSTGSRRRRSWSWGSATPTSTTRPGRASGWPSSCGANCCWSRTPATTRRRSVRTWSTPLSSSSSPG